MIAKSSIAAFRCAVIAAHARYDTDEKRLLMFFLAEARQFVEGVRANRVTVDEMTDFVWPLVLRQWNFQTLPTPVDIVAGQVYESIWEQTTASLGKDSSDSRSYQIPARTEFERANCSLVGL
jgi:hypothetical protein